MFGRSSFPKERPKISVRSRTNSSALELPVISLGNYSIRTKLLGGFFCAALMVLACGIIGRVAMNHLQTASDQLGTEALPAVRGIGIVSVGLTDLRRLELNLLQDRAQHDSVAYQSKMKELASWTHGELDRGLEMYSKVPRTVAGDSLFTTFSASLTAYRTHIDKVVTALDAGKDAEAAQLVAIGKRQFVDAYLDADGLMVAQDSAAALRVADARRVGAQGRLWITLVIVAAMAVALLLGWGLARHITIPLRTALDRAKRLRTVCVAELHDGITAMARGDLSVTPHSTTETLGMTRKDEVGELADTLDGLIVTTRETSEGFAHTQQIVRDVLQESIALSDIAAAGNLQRRGDTTRFEGAFKDLVAGVNQTLDAIVTPVNEAAEVMRRIAERDLTARMQGNYVGDHAKIKDSINTAAANLDDALSGITASTEQVATAATSIAEGSQSLAEGTSQQAASIEEISSSLQEVEAMVQQSAQAAGSAKELAEGAHSAVGRGEAGVQELTEAMSKIQASSEATKKIVKTIDEIAFQTNLLALNAAVEAARAGDAGRGFAVVAEEVRSLALRAAEAAKSTAALIEEGVKNTVAGTDASKHVAHALAEISTRTIKVTTVMTEIAAASDQQKIGITQVNAAVSQMSAGTQAAAANAEESAAAAEELAAQARMMQDVVARFTVDGAAADAAPDAAPAPAGETPRAHAGVAKSNGHGRLPASLTRPAARRVLPFAEV
jgi:methyl-accepting chemotaxis protein